MQRRNIQLLEEQPLLAPGDKSQHDVRHLRCKEVVVPGAEVEAKQSLCSPDLSTTAEEGADTKEVSLY